MTTFKLYNFLASAGLLLGFIFVAGFQSPSNPVVDPYKVDNNPPGEIEGYVLVWSDEFNVPGKPDMNNWGFEYGFVRNQELQWYQPQNAECKDGRLLITGKRERIENPNYYALSGDWRSTRTHAEYSSACLITKGKQEWESFGYFEIRARIDTTLGSWPAIWMLGTEDGWPYCGEIDIMEFYRYDHKPSILANVAWSSKKRVPSWDTSVYPLIEFLQNDPDWVKKYHTWSMEWTEESICLYLDGVLLNETSLRNTLNPDMDNPFTEDKKHYLLLNLALGSNGGDPDNSEMPITFEVDYARVYKPRS